MVFDQYQRYKTVQIVVEKIKQFYKIDHLSLLEIGSNEQRNLEKMLPNERIQYSDIELLDELENDPKFIVVDGRNMSQFEDGKYDAIIALDVLEHIKSDDREMFLSEVYRVSKFGAIVCFPHNMQQICSAERRANNYYRALYGEDHIWLKEHIDNGLPSLTNIEAWIKSRGYNYVLFQHGNIVIWEEMIKALFASYKNECFFSFMDSIDEIYEQQIYYHDIGKNNYRAFIFFGREKELLRNIDELLHIEFDSSVDYKAESFLLRNVDDLKGLGNIPTVQRKNTDRLRGTIYFNRNKGFSEEDVQYVYSINIGRDKYRCKTCISNLTNINAVRYDPIEGQSCIITKCSVKQSGRELKVEYSSNLAGDTGVILLGVDPMLVVYTENSKDEIILEVEFIIEGKKFIEETLSNFQDKQNSYLKSCYASDVLRSQLDEANRKISECTSKRNEIVSILQTSLEDCRKERDITISTLQRNLDISNRERDEGLDKIRILENINEEKKKELENIKKKKEEELENIKKEKEKELENIKKEKEKELGNIKKEKEELENIKREKEKELENIKKEKEELENIKKEKEEKLENMEKERELLFLDFQSISEMKDRQIKMMSRDLQKLTDSLDEIVIYRDKCNFLQTRLNKMEHTMSWKITKSLRILGSKLGIK